MEVAGSYTVMVREREFGEVTGTVFVVVTGTDIVTETGTGTGTEMVTTR